MKERNVKGLVIFATLISFVLLPTITEANGFIYPERHPKKAVQRKKEVLEGERPYKSSFAFRRELVIGTENTYMAERYLEHSSFSDDIQVESIQHLATLSYKLLDGFTLKGKIGAAKIKNVTWGYGWHDYELAWGIGGEWDVFKCLNKYSSKIPAALPYGIDMIVSGQYFTIDDDEEEARSTGDTLKERWEEWDTSIAFRKNCGAFTPYIGTRISWVEVKAKHISTIDNFDGRLKADDNIGVFIGTDIDVSKCGKLENISFAKDLSANFEIRALDELAFTGSLNYTLKF